MQPTADELVEMYRRMLRIRAFEERACELLQEGAVRGALHTSIGQEATAVGACMALAACDYVAGNHRSHGHPIAKGAALGPLMAELMGKKTGVCKGRGGSMHLADFSVGSIGESGIVGAGLPLATGAALSAQMRRSSQVALCFFGDGASNEGVFHESLNMAALWKLPVVYLCENNRYAATTPARDSSSVEHVADRAVAYGIPGVVVDGQDVVAVWRTTRVAVRRARDGLGPSIVEAETYRYREHAEGFPIPGSYRSEEEIVEWKRRDPIDLHRRSLLDGGTLDEGAIRRLEAEVRAEIEQAIELARSSPSPEIEELFDDLYATPTGSGPPAATPREAAHAERQISGFEAFIEALGEEMRRDERVFYIGEDIALYRSAFLADVADRVVSTPISEAGLAGAAVGAAMTGLRPVVELTVANFTYLAMDAIVNQAARLRYMTGGQARVPVVFRAAMWHGHSTAAQHSDRPYPMFMNVPGLKLVVPATPGDLKGLLKAAIRDDDPVLFFDELGMWFQSGPVPEGDFVIPLGVAAIKRTGSDVTLVAIGTTVTESLAAADDLAAGGISAEVIDPRTLVPLDEHSILESVAKTGRLVVVEPAARTAGAAAEISAIVAESGFSTLKAPIVRVTAPDVHVPFSPALEHSLYPTRDAIRSAVERQLSVGR